MSSIDKYVEGEARACNPNVRVEKRFGRIVGYIGKSKVFDIADRYGYLNDKERTIIRESIRAYEEEQHERERREQVRLENERVTARTELKRDIVIVRNAIAESYHSAIRLHSSVADNLNLSTKLSKLSGCDLSGYKARISEIEQKVRMCEDSIKRDYQMQLAAIDNFESGIHDDSSTQEYIEQRSALRRIRTSIVSTTLPVEEIARLESELDKLAEVLEKVKVIESELGRVSSNGLAGSIAQNAIREIHSTKIGSLEDVDNLLLKLQEQLAEINNVEFQSRTQERADQIALLDGISKACSQLRIYIVEQDYVAASYRTEIVETANAVSSVYSELRIADYTTCSEERIAQVCDIVQEILISTKADEQTLKLLRSLLDEGEIYKRNDALQADNYADYKRKIEELTSRGYPIEDIEEFDPFGYEEQSQRWNELLLEQDISEATSRTRTTFLMACKTMEDMGYCMLHYDMGGEEKEGDALACEAIYVMPGCEGVVWRLIASDCNISRKVIGIQRASGTCTTVDRVREVATQIETDGEIDEYFNRYSEAGGGELIVTSAIDSDTEGCDIAIADNGCFVLSEEGEAYYDQLMSDATAEQRAKWATRIPKNSHSITVSAKAGPSEREMESVRCKNNVQRAREKK